MSWGMASGGAPGSKKELIGLDVIIMARSGDFKWETSGQCTSTLLNSCVELYMEPVAIYG
jgi:hypothetical protein